MYKITITEDGVSNLPVEVFDETSDPGDVMKMILSMTKNPGRYRLVATGEFVWNEKNTHHFIYFFKPIMEIVKNDGSKIDLGMLYGYLQGACLLANEMELNGE